MLIGTIEKKISKCNIEIFHQSHIGMKTKVVKTIFEYYGNFDMGATLGTILLIGDGIRAHFLQVQEIN